MGGAAGLERSPVGPRVRPEDVNQKDTQTLRLRWGDEAVVIQAGGSLI